MATRKQVREALIQILYARELGNDNAIAQAKDFLHEQKIRNKQQEFALSLLHGICTHENHIAEVMNAFLKTWDIARLGVIEKNILKLGVYELLYTDMQQAIIINEAIELTKSFNVEDAFRLVNGVLDSVAKLDSTQLALFIQEHKEKQRESQQQTIVSSELAQQPLPKQAQKMRGKNIMPQTTKRSTAHKQKPKRETSPYRATKPALIESIAIKQKSQTQKEDMQETKKDMQDGAIRNKKKDSKNKAIITKKKSSTSQHNKNKQKNKQDSIKQPTTNTNTKAKGKP